MENGFIYKLSVKKLKYRKACAVGFFMGGLLEIGIGFWTLLSFDPEKFSADYKYVGLIMMSSLGVFFWLISLIFLWRYKTGIANFDKLPYIKIPEQYHSNIKKIIADVDKEDADGKIIY